MPTGLKIAIAASGLTHIKRGIESWALDTAAALVRAGEDVTLFQGTGPCDQPYQRALDCLPAIDPRAQKWARRWRSLGLWRVGLSSSTDVQQFSFMRRLRKLTRHEYDILHVQDAMLAYWMTSLHRRGLSRPHVILGHGTEEPPDWLKNYDNLQHLAPTYLDDWQQHRPPGQAVFAVPNFVDVAKFAPGDRAAARAEWQLPPDAFIVLCVAALRKFHKRVDYLIQEVAKLPDVLLVVAGARESETDEILQMATTLLGDRARMLVNVPRDRVVRLYQAADAFAIASLHEMMSVAVLEAMSCGLPVCCNDTPTLRWMTGPCGNLNKIDQPGALAAQIAELRSLDERKRRSALARARAVELFSEQAVVPQLQQMYREVASGK